MNITKKRVIIGATVAAIALSGTGVAYAYWTATGNGNGTASTGNSASWSVGQVAPSADGPLYPDPAVGSGHIQGSNYTVKNTGGGNQQLTHVVIAVDPNWSSRADGSKPACTAADFSVGAQPLGAAWTDTSLATPNPTFIANESRTGTVTVQMISTALNQDNCKNIGNIPLVFAAS